MRYDRARHNLGRHPHYILAAYNGLRHIAFCTGWVPAMPMSDCRPHSGRSGLRRPDARLTCYAAESPSAFRQRRVMRRPTA
jgi:hypothetical protein